MLSNTGIGLIGLVLIAGVILLFSSCRSKDIDHQSYEKSKVFFGGGGGFTGQSYEFCLLENGTLYAVNSLTNEYSDPVLIKKSEAKTLMNKVKAVNSKNFAYNEPGNLYKYIKTTKTDEEDVKLVWGNPDLIVDESVISLYNDLIAASKALDTKN